MEARIAPPRASLRGRVDECGLPAVLDPWDDSGVIRMDARWRAYKTLSGGPDYPDH